ncbi:MAG: hypothetical protein SF123_10890 [Chloroflexota bacterium]|nr:hypothetical protein [Chloroflexota bacterium]
MNQAQLTKATNEAIQAGVDLSSPEVMARIQQARDAAAALVPAPRNPDEQVLPKGFQTASGYVIALGRIVLLAQVLFIQGLAGGLITLGLLIVDTVRMAHIVSLFVSGGLLQAILALVVILIYTFLSLRKAELKYALGKFEKPRFSLRLLSDWWNYWSGDDPNWKVQTHSSTWLDYKRTSGFHAALKWGIALLLLLEAALVVFPADAISYTVTGEDGDEKTVTTTALELALAGEWQRLLVVEDGLQRIIGGIAALVVTMMTIVGLSFQLEGAYVEYVRSGGRTNSADFFAKLQQDYLVLCEDRARQAEHNTLKVLVAEAKQAQLAALAETAPMLPTPNGTGAQN